MEQKSLAG